MMDDKLLGVYKVQHITTKNGYVKHHVTIPDIFKDADELVFELKDGIVIVRPNGSD